MATRIHYIHLLRKADDTHAPPRVSGCVCGFRVVCIFSSDSTSHRGKHICPLLPSCTQVFASSSSCHWKTTAKLWFFRIFSTYSLCHNTHARATEENAKRNIRKSIYGKLTLYLFQKRTCTLYTLQLSEALHTIAQSNRVLYVADTLVVQSLGFRFFHREQEARDSPC